MILKKILFVMLLLSVSMIYAQTHKRKTRSDKGGHHKHSSSYYLKHGYGTTQSNNKHKGKGHSSSGGSSSLPLVTSNDSLKTDQVLKEKKILEKERNGHLMTAAMVLGIIFLISVIGYIVTQRKQKRKFELQEQERLDKLAHESKQRFERMERERLDRIEWEKNEKVRIENERTHLEKERIQFEKDKKIQFTNDLKNALERNTITKEQYDELSNSFEIKTISELEYALKDAKNEKKRVDILLLKYSEVDVIRILKHNYWIGMTEEQLIDAKGVPDKTEIEELKTKSKKIYIYGNKSSGDVFNFVDGRLERFKDR